MNWYSKIVNMFSYRIDEGTVNQYLSSECIYGAHITEEEYVPLLKELLNRLHTVPSNNNKQWIARNVIEKTGYKTDSYRVLFSPVLLNHIRYVNKYFRKYNKLLETGGDFVCMFETGLSRKLTIFKKYPAGIANLIYLADFIWHRIMPKLPYLKKIYFGITKGENRVYPRSEILGRLYCCGFKVIGEECIRNQYYVIAKKTQDPSNNPHPSYGPLVRLRRVGKNGELFNVYKFRTMHAYSEYLQTYIYEYNHLQANGKFANDYRVANWGKIMRKYWLDEIPMFINLLKGNVKLVGVRPLSEQYYGLYSPTLQQLRIQTKPGLLPPFYVDMPKNLEEIEISETKYLESYLKHPCQTDLKYFGKILYSIFVKQKRSA